MRFTATAYHDAALEHITVARDLLERQNYPQANYIAGLAVECILRAYAWNYDRTFDCRHDIAAWYDAARFDDAVPPKRVEEIAAALGIIVTHWMNSQRYCSTQFLRAYFKQFKLDRGIRGDFVKELTRRTVDAAFVLVSLGESNGTTHSKSDCIA